MEYKDDELLKLAKNRISTRQRFKEIAKNNLDLMDKSRVDSDKFLASLLKKLKVRSIVIGIGGAGNNTISRMNEDGFIEFNTLNVNTDAHDLYYSNAKQKLLIGKNICNGLGSGNDPRIGAAAAEEDADRISELVDKDVVFLTFGLGGGTGTGAAPIIAREAKKRGAIVVSFCSIPFTSEGKERRERAKMGLNELAKHSDTLITIPNDNLLRFNKNLPILTGFKIMDEVLIRCISEILFLIDNCGLINIDFADIKKVLKRKGKYPTGLIGITETLGDDDDLIKKARLAINNPLLDPDPNQVDNCIVSVSGDHKLSLSKVDKVINTISSEIPERALLKFGTALNPSLGEKIRIMVLGSGYISPYVHAAVDNLDFPNPNFSSFNIN
ncbi:MAG: cell division protein FtsZ [Promethearchaeota archaeon]